MLSVAGVYGLDGEQCPLFGRCRLCAEGWLPCAVVDGPPWFWFACWWLPLPLAVFVFAVFEDVFDALMLGQIGNGAESWE